MKKSIRVLLLTLFMAIIACQQTSQVEEGNRVPVAVEEAELGKIKKTLTFQGDIEAEVSVKVFSKIPDRILTYYVDEGDTVQAGEGIAKILATTIEQGMLQADAALAAARAQYFNMKIEYERARRLFDQNAMSKQQYDGIVTQYEAAEAQMHQAEAVLESAKSQLKDAYVVAPISGIVGKRYYETGDVANPAMPLVELVKMEKVKTVFEATEQDLGQLKTGQQADILVKAYPDKVFDGIVKKISPVLDPYTRMATVEVIVNNQDYLLKPGMFAEVTVTTGMIKDVVVIPRHAVLENTSLQSVNGKDRVIKQYFVFVVSDSLKSDQRLLHTVYVNHEGIAIDSGVKVGEKLIVAGQNNLRDNQSVMISEEE